MSTPVVVVGLTAQDSVSINKVDGAGNYYQHGHRAGIPDPRTHNVYAIALDSDGNSYLGIGNTSFIVDSTYALNQDGYLIWSADHGNGGYVEIWDIVLDDVNRVLYTVGQPVNSAGSLYPDAPSQGGGPSGDRTGYYTTRAYNATTGALLWSADHGWNLLWGRMCIAYRNGYVYTGGYYDSTLGYLRKYNATTGAVVWTVSAGSVAKIAIDASDNVYAAGLSLTDTTYYYLRKYNSSGTLIASGEALADYSGNHPYLTGIVIDSSGDLIISTDILRLTSGGDAKMMHKYNSSLVFQYHNGGDMDAHLAAPLGLAIDADDDLYFCTWDTNGVVGQLNGIWKVPADIAAFATTSDYLFSVKTQGSTGSTSVAWCLALREVQTPALKIPISFGIPTLLGDLYSAIPGLPLTIGLYAPSCYRDYVGNPLPSIYRAFLGDWQLFVSSFSIRYTQTTGSVDLVVPLFNETDLTEIESRWTDPLIVYKGIRFNDGTEQSDILISVLCTSLRFDRGSSSISLSLSGQATLASTHQATRQLSKISYRLKDQNGQRIRCNVDTYLRPNDIADLGSGETMLVDNITIFVDSTLAFMEITGA